MLLVIIHSSPRDNLSYVEFVFHFCIFNCMLVSTNLMKNPKTLRGNILLLYTNRSSGKGLWNLENLHVPWIFCEIWHVFRQPQRNFTFFSVNKVGPYSPLLRSNDCNHCQHSMRPPWGVARLTNIGPCQILQYMDTRVIFYAAWDHVFTLIRWIISPQTSTDLVGFNSQHKYAEFVTINTGDIRAQSSSQQTICWWSWTRIS